MPSHHTEISQRYVEIWFHLVLFDTIPSLVGPHLFEANCPKFSVCGAVVHGRVITAPPSPPPPLPPFPPQCSEDPGQVTYHLEEQGAVHQSKEVLPLLSHPFFMCLYFTFQDRDNLCMLVIQRSWISLVRGSCLFLSVLWLSLLGWWITVSQGVCLPWPSFAYTMLHLIFAWLASFVCLPGPTQ